MHLTHPLKLPFFSRLTLSNRLNLTMAHITEADFALAAEDLVFHAMHKINKVRNGFTVSFLAIEIQRMFDKRMP